MAKTELAPRGSVQRSIAEIVWKHIVPGNPHGPQSDLYFETPYVRDSAEEATRIANELVEKGLDFRRGPASNVTPEILAEVGPPMIIEPAQDIVSLVSALSNETVDMTIQQALDLRLLLSIKGHSSDLYLAQGEEMWLRCTCGKFDVNVGGAQEDLEALTAGFIAHLKAVVSASKLDDLPDGTYNDGVYDWEKEGTKWEPLRAPSGMPPKPDIDRLRRVIIDRKYEAI